MSRPSGLRRALVLSRALVAVVVGAVGLFGWLPVRASAPPALSFSAFPLLQGLPSVSFQPNLPQACQGASGPIPCGPFNDLPSLQGVVSHVISGLAWASGLMWQNVNQLWAGLANAWNDSSMPADVVAYVRGLVQDVVDRGGVMQPGAPPADITQLWSDLESGWIAQGSNVPSGASVVTVTDTWSAAHDGLQSQAPIEDGNSSSPTYGDSFGCNTATVGDIPGAGNVNVQVWWWPAFTLPSAAGSPSWFFVDGASNCAVPSGWAYPLTGVGSSAQQFDPYISYTDTSGVQHTYDGAGNVGTNSLSCYYANVTAAFPGGQECQVPAGIDFTKPVQIGLFASGQECPAGFNNPCLGMTGALKVAAIGFDTCNTVGNCAPVYEQDASVFAGSTSSQSGMQLAPGVSVVTVPSGQQIAAPLHPDSDMVGTNIGQPLQVQTVQGTTVSQDENAPSQAWLVGPLLSGVQNLVVADRQREVEVQQQAQTVWGDVQTLVPFVWVMDFYNTVNSFFTPAGSDCTTAKVDFNYQLHFSGTGPAPSPDMGSDASHPWHIQLCDVFGILATVRSISSWVIYAMVFAFGWWELRNWMRWGGMSS